MNAKYLLISETAIDHMLGRRQVRSPVVPDETTPGIYTRSLSTEIVGMATGREADDDYLALVSLEVLRSLSSNFEAVFSRISRVLKSAARPPIHLSLIHI